MERFEIGIGAFANRLLLMLALIALAGCSGGRGPSATPAAHLGKPLTGAAFETMNALDAAAHPPRDRFSEAVSIRHIPAGQLKASPVEAPELGDRHEFTVLYDQLKDYRVFPATLRHVSENALWWVADKTQVTDQDLKVAADNFESTGLKIDRLIYGHEPAPGIDGYDRVNFLFIDMADRPTFGGYFSNTNQYPKAIERFSNEQELMVINTAGRSLRSVDFTSVLAHEFGHLIMYAGDPNEDLWLNEGSSELASFFTASPEIGAEMDEPNERVFANYPFIQLTARPDTTAPGFDVNTVFAHYGAEKLFMIYLVDRFGPRFIRDLLANPEAGVRSLNQELGKLDLPLTFNQVYADWILANLLNQPDHPQGRYGYSEEKALLPYIIRLNQFTGEKLPGFMPPYSTFYHELDATDEVTVDFKGATTARLTPVDPYEGKYSWYSNRGDNTTFSLTRSFDLTDVKSATLNYRVWYDTEKDFDYGYVLASTDGGSSWDVLPTRYGRAEDLSDEAWGIGYTGNSKGWLRESLDLAAYAGKRVVIRFAVNNDLAVNLPGLMLDNIAIPAIDYFDGAEDDQGGWESQGFVRSSNTVPVEWVVWIVKVNVDPNKEDEVIRVDLDDLQSAKFDINGFGEDFDFAAMVISPMAPTTTQSIDYEFALTGR